MPGGGNWGLNFCQNDDLTLAMAAKFVRSGSEPVDNLERLSFVLRRMVSGRPLSMQDRIWAKSLAKEGYRE